MGVESSPPSRTFPQLDLQVSFGWITPTLFLSANN